MVHVPGTARLSFSSKAGGRTPEAPLEADPSRGRSILAYPQHFASLAQVLKADGSAADATRYPFGERHEDLIVLAEAPGQRLGWSAALAEADGFLFFAIKDARRLPETILWLSNGGRSYAPWLDRHRAVIGIEEAATSLHAIGRVAGAAASSQLGHPTGLTLAAGMTASICYAFGAVAAPSGWSQVADIVIGVDELTLVDASGARLTVPFFTGHFAD
jgi:hypothetical protein